MNEQGYESLNRQLLQALYAVIHGSPTYTVERALRLILEMRETLNGIEQVLWCDLARREARVSDQPDASSSWHQAETRQDGQEMACAGRASGGRAGNLWPAQARQIRVSEREGRER